MMTVNNKTIQINRKEILLEHTIRKYIEYEKCIVLLMYDEVVTANNVVCFDKQGEELWRINDILNIKRPTGNIDIVKESDDILLVYSVLGMVYKMDIVRGKLIEKKYLK